MTGNNPVDRSKLDTKRHILTDKQGIPLSVVISSASTHDIKAVTDVIDNSVIKRTFVSSKPKEGMKQRRAHHHLCLDRAYQSRSKEQEIIKRGFVPNIPYKRKRGQSKAETVYQKRCSSFKNKRWVVERTNSWHNRLENFLFDTKRRLKITWAWYNYRAVSLSIER
jgi:transposase